jgi:hypothetical protein
MIWHCCCCCCFAVGYVCVVVLFWLGFLGLKFSQVQNNPVARAEIKESLYPLIMVSVSRTLSYFYLPITTATLFLMDCRSVNVPSITTEGVLQFKEESRWVMVSIGKNK